MAIKMRDVARYAAVSVATVSRALNEPSKVNEETRQRVFEAVQALGYSLNTTARSLRIQKTYNIALVFSSMMYAPFVEAIESVALDYGLIKELIFVALVTMALVTSLISGPALRLILHIPGECEQDRGSKQPSWWLRKP